MSATIVQECWKPVVGHGSRRYEVSDLGRIRRTDRQRLLKASPIKSGYLKVTLWQGGIYRQAYVHTLVLESFVGPRPTGLEARHLDDDRARNVLKNLCWGTYQENAADAAANGRVCRGSQHPGAKLTETDVATIRDESSVKSIRALAKSFGVAHSTIERIVSGRMWRHVHA